MHAASVYFVGRVVVFELEVGSIPDGLVVGFWQSLSQVNHIFRRPDGLQQRRGFQTLNIFANLHFLFHKMILQDLLYIKSHHTCRVSFVGVGIEQIADHSGKLIRVVSVNFAVIPPDNFLGQNIHIPSSKWRFQMQQLVEDAT